MDNPGDGWNHDLVRACTLYTGSFCSFVQRLNAIADRLQWKRTEDTNVHKQTNKEDFQKDRFDGDLRRPQNNQNATMSNQFRIAEPLRLGSDGGALMAGRSTSFVLFCAARRLASQRKTWLRAAGLATAASLSAAMAATSAELHPLDSSIEQMELAESEANSPSTGSEEGSQSTTKSAFALSSEETCLDPILGEDEGELSSACISFSKGISKGAVVEPKTKARFPVLLCDDGEEGTSTASESCQVLAGVGIRSKSIIKLKSIKVYAFGLYVRPEKIREFLGEKYAGVPPEELKLREDFYDDLLSREVGMTVRLVVHYKGLSMEMVRSAFVTSLKNRLRKIKGTEDDEGLNVFSGYFSQPMDISRGTVIDFCWQPGGRLLTQIAGKTMEPIVSPHLCRAFFDLYIGEPPVSEVTKQEIGESCARMLKAC